MLQLNYGVGEVDGDPFEGVASARNLARIWALRMLCRMQRADRAPRPLLAFLREAGVLDPELEVDSTEELRAGCEALNSPDRLKARLAELESEPWAPEGVFSDNVAWLVRRFELDPPETAVLVFLAFYGWLDWFRAAAAEFFERRHVPCRTSCISFAAGVPRSQVSRAVAHGGRLFRAGLITCRFSDPKELPELADSIVRSIFSEPLDHRRIQIDCVRVAPRPECSIDDFGENHPALRLIRETLGGVAVGAGSPCQILLHGRPGTGKTAFARALARELRLGMREVLETDETGAPLNPGERLERFRLAQAILEATPRCLLLFDEADKVLAWSELEHKSWDKAWINRVIESARVPCIWIANRLSDVHPAILRRFQIVQEMPRMRTRTLLRVFKWHTRGLPLDDRWMRKLVETGRVTPGLIRNAAEVARTVPDQKPEILQRTIYGVLDGHCHATSGRRLVHGLADSSSEPELPWRAAWLETEPDLDELLRMLKDTTVSRLRLLFHGPPGGGKTALARKLAERLDRPLVTAPASELLSCWIGETEKNIARLFEQAEADGALLFLDEADSFLHRRDQAMRSWEVTQVNELLVQMEGYQGIFIAATNRVDTLDPACLRRLDIKVRFDYLRPKSLKSMCRAVLGRKGRFPATIEDRLNVLDHLMPGDFPPVLRRMSTLNRPLSAENLVTELEQEMAGKPEGRRQRMGFLS